MNNYMNFEGHNIEVFEFEGQILFNPYDVGRCLGISDNKTRKLISKMSENQLIKLENAEIKNMEIRVLDNLGEEFLTEAGTYALISKGKQPQADRLLKWILEAVIPTYRQETVHWKSVAELKQEKREPETITTKGITVEKDEAAKISEKACKVLNILFEILFWGVSVVYIFIGVALTPNGFFSGLSMVLGGVLVNPEIRKIIKARTTYPIWLCLIACILAFFVSIALWE
jgi:prophage antirepressor-like protein